MRRIAVIMAGGSGERFWPLSRALRPKQLLNLASETEALLGQTISRLQPLIEPANIFIATAPHLVEPSKGHVGNVPEGNVRAEPYKRNTAGCLVWVAAALLAEDEDARKNVSMAVIAADHRIHPDEGFRATLDACLNAAEQTGGIVTIGITPGRPETGYGYIEVGQGDSIGTSQVPIYPVGQFREKPDRAQAEAFLAAGSFLWNSGTFFWTLDTFLSELETAAPDLYAAVIEIAGYRRQGEEDRANEVFESIRSISIDYALMEQAKKVFVAKAAFEWDDVGAWDALHRSLPQDSAGNVQRGEVVLVESNGCVVVNENAAMTTCLLGVEDMVVVVTEDAVLVMPKDRAQDVRSIVEQLKSRGIKKT